MSLSSFDLTVKLVSEATGVDAAQIKSVAPGRRICSARRIAFYILYVHFDYSYSEIAKMWGYSSHSNVCRSCQYLFDHKASSHQLSHIINSILSKLKKDA